MPEGTIRERFEAGWQNFGQIYVPLVDSWILWDNSAVIPQLLEHGGNPATARRDWDLEGVEAALRRAALVAQAWGARTGTPVCVLRDGEIADLTAEKRAGKGKGRG